MNIYFESTRCLLCHDAPCTKACVKGLDPARGIRSLKLENEHCTGLFMNSEACSQCDAPCEKACIQPDFPVRIRETALTIQPKQKEELPSLAIDYCGIHCENPFFLASSVVGSGYDMIAKAFRMGWAGVAYKTISSSKIYEVSPRFDCIGHDGTPFIGFRNMEQLSVNTPEEDFAILARLKKDFPAKVLIASIMGNTDDDWARLAKMAEEAGCDMVECNFSCPHMAEKGRGSDVGQKPELVHHLTQVVKSATKLPVIVKMTPNITHIEDPAIAAVEAGADSISAINTIKSVTMKRRGEVAGKGTVSGYSGKAIKPIAQRFILDIRKNERLKDIPLSGIGGIESWRDALQFILLGCSSVQIATAVMQYGYRIIEDLTLGLQDWMKRENISSLGDVVGKASDEFVTTDQLDRSTYILPKIDRSKCIGCGRCYISCFDGGHQAISFDTETRTPHIVGKSCVGCHLCILVCPVSAISPANRIELPSERLDS